MTNAAREDDATIAKRISSGDRFAEDELVRRYRDKLVNMLSGLSGSHTLAEDLTHEALITVIDKLRSDKLLNAACLASYLYQTARYMYFGNLRKHETRTVLIGSFDDHIDASVGVERSLIDRERSDWLKDRISELSVKRDRDILFRLYVVGQQKREICEVLELSPDQFDRVSSRARGRLKKRHQLVG